MLLSLKKKPLIRSYRMCVSETWVLMYVRFQGTSEACQSLALEVYNSMDDGKNKRALFDFAQSLDNQPLLLVCDAGRLDDWSM